MLSLWRHRYIEGTAAGGLLFSGYHGNGHALRIHGEPATQIAAATTNYIANPSFETGVANWTNNGLATMEQSSAYSQFGKYSMHCVSNAAAWSEWCYSDAVAEADDGEVWTASCWVYLVKGDFFLGIQKNAGGWSDVGASGLLTTLNTWTRVSLTVTMPAGTTDGRVRVGPNDVAVSEFYVDGVQFEQGAYPTPFCDGSLDDALTPGTGGHAWTGTAHASISTRTAANLYWPTATLGLSRSTTTVDIWIKPNTASTQYGDYYVWTDAQRFLYFDQSESKFSLSNATDTVIPAATQTYAKDTLIHLTAVMGASTYSLYRDGALIGSVAVTVTPAWGANFYVGTDVAGTSVLNGLVANLAIYNDAKTAAEVLQMHQHGPGPFTGAVFYAPLTESVHAEAGEAISFDGFVGDYHLRYDGWKPTVPVMTSHGADSYERDGADLVAGKYGNVNESIKFAIDTGACSTGQETLAKRLERLGGIIDTAQRWSLANATGSGAVEAVDLIYRPGAPAGRLARSRVLGWIGGAVNPDRWEDVGARLGKFEGMIAFEREPFWRCAERPLGNEPTTIYTHDDADAGHNNYIDVAGAASWIEGKLPAPALLWVTNATANTYDEFYAAIAQDRLGAGVTPVAWLEAEDEVSFHATATQGADATSSAAVMVTVDTAITDYCVKLDGVDAYMTNPDVGAAGPWDLCIAAGGAMTIEFFIKFYQLPAATCSVILKSGSYSVTVGTTGIVTLTAIGTGFTLSATSAPLSINNWHHVYVYYQARTGMGNGTMEIGIDGQRVAFQQQFAYSTLTDAATAFTVGGTGLNAFFYIDELRISNAARYGGATYTVPTAEFADDGSTVAFYHFNEGTGNPDTDNAEGTASLDLDMINFSGVDADKWAEGYFSTGSGEVARIVSNVPQSLTEDYAGRYLVLVRAQVKTGGTAGNISMRGRWNVTNGLWWSTDYKYVETAAQWEWVELGVITLPWYRVPADWIQRGVMDTVTNRQFGLYTAHGTASDDLYVDAYQFLPVNGFFAHVDLCSMAQSHGFCIDWLSRKPVLGKTGATMYSYEFLAGMEATTTPLMLRPGKQGRLFMVFSRANKANVFDDSLTVYPLRYRPLYLTMPADE